MKKSITAFIYWEKPNDFKIHYPYNNSLEKIFTKQATICHILTINKSDSFQVFPCTTMVIKNIFEGKPSVNNSRIKHPKTNINKK